MNALFLFWLALTVHFVAKAPTAAAGAAADSKVTKWPTKMVVVAALTTRPGSLFGLYQPQWAARHHVSIFNYQTHDPDQPLYTPVSAYAIENVAYFRFIVEHYHNLPETTVFVHADVSCHNPFWLEWLDCLRPEVKFTSLSPIFVENRITRFAAEEEINWFVTIFNLSSEYKRNLQWGKPRNFYCCEHWVIRREALLQYPLLAYRAIYFLAAADRLSAFLIEFNFHVLFGEKVAGPMRSPCEHFYCEREHCNRSRVGETRLFFDRSRTEMTVRVDPSTGARSFGPRVFAP